MRNSAQLLQLRRAGLKPAHVRFTDQREAPRAAWWQWPETQPFAEIHVEPHDSAAVQDLRFVVGLPVLVDIVDPMACASWAQAAKAAGASLVIALYPIAEVV